MTRPPSGDREGMILINVLFVVAVAMIVVMMMVTTQDVAIDRTARFRDVAQATAYARAGEASAIVALRRDAVEEPDSDYPGEAWGAVEDRDVVIRGGRFSLKVNDDQARFNLNNLGAGDLAAEALFERILVALGLSDDLLEPIISHVRVSGPVETLEEFTIVGVEPDDIQTLSQLTTLLPGETTINLNTADERLLAVIFDSPVTARLVDSTRRRRGYLTPADLAALNAPAPRGTGLKNK
jgi:general secretion pathway protein K